MEPKHHRTTACPYPRSPERDCWHRGYYVATSGLLSSLCPYHQNPKRDAWLQGHAAGCRDQRPAAPKTPMPP